MKTIGGMNFPETMVESQNFKRETRVIALAYNVLAVATTRREGKWSAYIASVPGQNHDDEWEEVVRQGVKLPKGIAEAIFPTFKDVPYAK